MEERILYAVCGEKLSDDNLREFDGQMICEQCFYEKTTVCDNCGDRIWRDDNEEDSVHTSCLKNMVIKRDFIIRQKR